jgi:hypothetical protein
VCTYIYVGVYKKREDAHTYTHTRRLKTYRISRPVAGSIVYVCGWKRTASSLSTGRTLGKGLGVCVCVCVYMCVLCMCVNVDLSSELTEEGWESNRHAKEKVDAPVYVYMGVCVCGW